MKRGCCRLAVDKQRSAEGTKGLARQAPDGGGLGKKSEKSERGCSGREEVGGDV